MNVLLTEYVENVGQPGECVEIWAKTGRELILKHKAVYPTPENKEKYRDATALNIMNYSSRYVKNTMDILSKLILFITMNKDVPWTLEPWHVRVAFRKAHIIVPDHAITLPKNPIKGPDLTLNGKEFYVTVTINKTEQVIVRSRIVHWTSKVEERLPWVPFPFKKPAPLLFEEDKVIEAQLPAIEPLKMNEDELEDFIAKMKLKSQGKILVKKIL
ncbi:39S ribosomal protein L9, mitochondrial isoform X2 [Folsomia candida]|nr:39S ribosomal protein L9, mitochondrial isoform X2 [Folsomia candida]